MKIKKLLFMLLFGVMVCFFQNCGLSNPTRSIHAENSNPLDSASSDRFELDESLQDDLPDSSISPDTPLDEPKPETPSSGNNEDVTPPSDSPVTPQPQTVFNFEALDAKLTLDMLFVGGLIYRDPASLGSSGPAGVASFEVTIEDAGEYVIDAYVDALTTGSNSFYVNFDVEPSMETVWHLGLTDGIELQRVSRGGDVVGGNPEHRFILNQGTHTLYFLGREVNTKLRSLTIRKVD